jgi:hypothetical protein
MHVYSDKRGPGFFVLCRKDDVVVVIGRLRLVTVVMVECVEPVVLLVPRHAPIIAHIARLWLMTNHNTLT